MTENLRHQQLSAYLDDELEPAGRSAFETVLQDDPELREQLNAYKRLSNELRVDETDKQVADVIRANLRRRRRRRTWLAWLPAAPVLASLVLAAVLLWPGSSSPGVPTITSDDLFNQYTEAVIELGE